MASYGQNERQRTRSRDGKYKEMNGCERCSKSVGTEYCSDGRFNGEVGHVLCRKCAFAGSRLSASEAVAFYKNARV